jgi:nucleoside-diphosphate-sugar epimerase
MRRHLAARVLVTGGSGLLGSHLCDRLLADGNEVLCVAPSLRGALATKRSSSFFVACWIASLRSQ